jgi:hypothetical protein
MSSFKQELQKYQWPRSGAVRAQLLRWLNDPRAEDIWQEVNQAMGPGFSPAEFITFVTRARSRAVGLPAFLAQSAREPAAEEVKQRIEQALNSKKTLLEIADLLEMVASAIRSRESFSELYRAGLPSNAINRKKAPENQQLRAFCLILGNSFHDRCGRWLDNEVAALADIALNRRKKNNQTHSDKVATFRKDRKVLN